MNIRPELARPLCNRVTPFGEIVRHPARGTLFGNRGCLHDDVGNIVRPATIQAWITCKIPAAGWSRSMMEPGRYTQLFFLDEATALAAGHRPCGYCQPERLEQFKRAWQSARSLGHFPRVAEIDMLIRAEQQAALQLGDWREMPDGVMMTDAQRSAVWLIRAQALHRWSWHGYETRSEQIAPDRTITVPSIIAVLGTGKDRYSLAFLP